MGHALWLRLTSLRDMTLHRSPAGFLGVLMLDTRFPRVPGDVGNPASFAIPVKHRVVAGASPQRVVREGDPSLLQPFVDAAKAVGPRRCARDHHQLRLPGAVPGDDAGRAAGAGVDLQPAQAARADGARRDHGRCAVARLGAPARRRCRRHGADGGAGAGLPSAACPARRSARDRRRGGRAPTWSTRRNAWWRAGRRCARSCWSAPTCRPMPRPWRAPRGGRCTTSSAFCTNAGARCRERREAATLNLRFVEAFYWVVTLESVTRAADKLHLTQSAVSSRIAALESELGHAADRSARPQGLSRHRAPGGASSSTPSSCSTCSARSRPSSAVARRGRWCCASARSNRCCTRG